MKALQENRIFFMINLLALLHVLGIYPLAISLICDLYCECNIYYDDRTAIPIERKGGDKIISITVENLLKDFQPLKEGV